MRVVEANEAAVHVHLVLETCMIHLSRDCERESHVRPDIGKYRAI